MQNKYPLWKNLLLIGLAIVGFIYALPNIYGEVPALQISSSSSGDMSALQQKIEALLNQSQLKYSSIFQGPDQIEVRFPSTDIQLHARDVLKHALDSHYTVALNLLPSTPGWLSRIGAEPMKQGLDLRGGVHFLLQVDVDSVINRRYEGLMKGVGQALREASVRYANLTLKPKAGLFITFKSQDFLSKGQRILEEKYAGLVMSVDESNMTILLSLSPQELDTIRQNTIEQTMTILRKRVNELGVGEAVVQQQGSTRIAVDLPGIQDAARAKQILGGTATLEFHLVEQDVDVAEVQKTGVAPLGSKLYSMNGYPILLKRQVVLNGDSITSATSTFDSETASPAVSIHLGGGGETFFTKVTRENVGRRLAIVYVESKTEILSDEKGEHPIVHREERVISAPVINSALGNQFQITGMTDVKEATNLALLLRAGALPTVIYPIEERTVGPSLGKENIHRGIVSLTVGMAFSA
jgi:preprotein translocase subunit SecD